MCGRFVIYANKDDVEKMFDVRKFLSVLRPSYNVAPTQDVSVVIKENNDNVLATKSWGIQLGKFKVINTRAETMEKPFFKNMERCIIIANGFYEWKNKQPRYITLEKRKLFGLAGIMRENECSIITTSPNLFMKSIHDRMPAILPKGKEEQWLTEKSLDLLKPSKEDMQAIEVSTFVNSPKNNSSECIKSIK